VVAARPAIPVIINPTAGGGRLLWQRLEMDAAAHHCGVELAWWLTDFAGHATELARRAAGEGYPMVFAFGGDGTYNEVASGLLGSTTALAALPGGTTSVLAYEFAIPRPAAAAVVALTSGEDRPMRVGRIEGGGIFVLMLSAGPDTVVLERLGPGLKRLGGRLGVAAQAMLELARGQPLPHFRLRVRGEELACGWVIVGNARSYAGPFRATPGADAFRAGFQVVALRSSRRLSVVSFALGLPLGLHLRRRDVVCLETDELELLAPAGTVAHQVDGDVAGTLPVRVSVDPQALVVRLPRQ
jgi:diacylglycerol kinase family enzyme